MTEPLTVTLTLKLTGPTANETAHHLLSAITDGETLTGSTIDGVIVESANLTDRSPGGSRERSPAPIVIDTISRKVLVDGVASRFTRREYDLLLFLAEHPGAAVTRKQLLRTVWGHEFSGERTVDVHVRRIRSKLDEHSDMITTVHGFGYRMENGEQVSIRRD